MFPPQWRHMFYCDNRCFEIYDTSVEAETRLGSSGRMFWKYLPCEEKGRFGG